MNFKQRFSSMLLVVITGITAQNYCLAQTGPLAKPTHPEWIYREWPTDTDFLALVANVPNLHAMDPTMFRYVFGSMPVRLSMTDGEARALVIGQDGTHGAEVAGEPFNGAGTGGRGQHMVYHMTGGDEGVYMNTFTYTIKKQYGDFAPVVYTDVKTGNREISYKSILTPNLYLLAQHPNSEFVKFRNKLIDAILARNPKIEIILGYGRAASDTIATYLESKGVKIESKGANTKMVDYNCEHDVANKTLCYPIDAAKNNLMLLPNERRGNSPLTTPQKELIKKRQNDKKFMTEVVLPQVVERAIVYPGQLGKNLDGKGTAGIRGLYTIKVGTQTRNLITKAGPHPGAVAGEEEKIAEKIAAIEAAYQKIFKEIMDARNYLNLDFNSGMTKGVVYKYDHRDIPNNKVFSSKKSSGASTDASRSGAQVINFGGREKPTYDIAATTAAKKSISTTQVAQLATAGNIPWDATRVNPAVFHRPVKEWIKFIVEKISPITNGSAIWNLVSNSKDHGYFGVYRGNFKQPETIILTDSSVQDLDALITGMALSGPNGRKLQAYLKSQALDKNYLILNLLPFDMTQPANMPATQKDAKFKQALDMMKPWYMAVIQKLMAQAPKGKPVKVIMLGQYVSQAVDLTPKAIGNVKVEVTNLSASSLPINGIDIPMGDLFHGERVWMGKGIASSILRSTNYPGKIYGWVAPDEVAFARIPMGRTEQAYFNFVKVESQGGKKFPIVFKAPAPDNADVDAPIQDELNMRN